MMQNHFSMFDNVMSNMRKSMEEMNRDFVSSPKMLSFIHIDGAK